MHCTPQINRGLYGLKKVMDSSKVSPCSFQAHLNPKRRYMKSAGEETEIIDSLNNACTQRHSLWCIILYNRDDHLLYT